MVHTFLVLSVTDHSCVHRTDDLREARAFCRTHDAVIAFLAEGPAFSAVIEFLSKNAERLGLDGVKYRWKAERLATDPHCDYCRRPCKRSATVDHKIPLCRGGSHTADNFALACAECNIAKGESTVDEFRERLLSGILFKESPAELATV